MMLPYGPSQLWGLVNLTVIGALLCGALFMELVLGMSPCPLCMMQRLWFALAGVIIFIGLAHNPGWGIYPLLATAAATVGGGFSIRQLWLQSLPADQVPACGPDLQYMLEVFPASDVLAAMASGTGDCAAISFQFIGITLPGWALLGFVAVAALCILQLRASLHPAQTQT